MIRRPSPVTARRTSAVLCVLAGAMLGVLAASAALDLERILG